MKQVPWFYPLANFLTKDIWIFIIICVFNIFLWLKK